MLSLWRGVGPTSVRASVVAGVELGLYDNIKVISSLEFNCVSIADMDNDIVALVNRRTQL